MKNGNDLRSRKGIILRVGLSLIGIIITGLVVWSILSETDKARGDKPEIKIENLSDTIKELHESYNNFRNMSGRQLHSVWNKLYYDSEYQLDGKVRNNEYDCGTAEANFWRALGANVVYEATLDKEARFLKYGNKHTSVKKVLPGDIIIFKRYQSNGRMFGHIAVVERVRKGLIRYMDMNAGDNGQGFKTIKFADERINAIYPMSFDYWVGDILYTFGRTEER